MGNLQVRFLEGWAPAMAPGYSTLTGLDWIVEVLPVICPESSPTIRVKSRAISPNGTGQRRRPAANSPARVQPAEFVPSMEQQFSSFLKALSLCGVFLGLK